MSKFIEKPNIPRGVYHAADRNSWPNETRDAIFTLIDKAGAVVDDTFQVVVSGVGAGIYQYQRDANGRAFLSTVDGEVAEQEPVFVRFK